MMLFKAQEFTVRVAGDDYVGVPILDAEAAVLACEAAAELDAWLRRLASDASIVPWVD